MSVGHTQLSAMLYRYEFNKSRPWSAAHKATHKSLFKSGCLQTVKLFIGVRFKKSSLSVASKFIQRNIIHCENIVCGVHCGFQAVQLNEGATSCNGGCSKSASRLEMNFMTSARTTGRTVVVVASACRVRVVRLGKEQVRG
jgi:hypothetical protein